MQRIATLRIHSDVKGDKDKVAGKVTTRTRPATMEAPSTNAHSPLLDTCICVTVSTALMRRFEKKRGSPREAAPEYASGTRAVVYGDTAKKARNMKNSML